MSMTPETIILDFGYTKSFEIIKLKVHNPFNTVIFGNLIIFQIESVGKDACRKSLRSVLSDLENLEYGISIFKNAMANLHVQLN